MSENQVILTREDAVVLFVGLGFVTASKWSTDRMNTKIQRILETVDEETEVGEEARPILDRILEAGDDVEVVVGEADKKIPAAKKERVKAIKERELAEKETATPEVKKEKKTTAPKNEKTRKMSRIHAIVLILQSIPKKGIIREEFFEKADALYVENSGKLSDPIRTKQHFSSIVPVLQIIGGFEFDKDRIYPPA